VSAVLRQLLARAKKDDDGSATEPQTRQSKLVGIAAHFVFATAFPMRSLEKP
jgi:hypothetical protein